VTSLHRWPTKRLRPVADRFWEKVRIAANGCWEWTARLHHGYGFFKESTGRLVYSHRWAYVDAFGPIPEGLEVDHLCRNTSCVRPSHLEAVTHRENLLRGHGFVARKARQTHCIHGHEFSERNTYLTPAGLRTCRECNRQNKRKGGRE